MTKLSIQLVFWAAIFSSSLFSAQASNASWDESKGEFAVFIPGTVDADAFARVQLEKLEGLAQFSDTIAREDLVIDIVHMGEELPTELRWTIDHFKRKRFKLRVSLVNQEETNQIVDELEEGVSLEQVSANYHLYYSRQREDAPFPLFHRADIGKFKRLWRSFLVPVRKSFGIPQGISWIMYRDSFTKRSAKQHLGEALSAVIQAGFMFSMQMAIALDAAKTDPSLLFPIAGASVAAGFKLLTGYIERANNEFFVQGNSISSKGRFDINRKFFLASAYAHSILIGLAVQWSLRGTIGMSSHIVTHTMFNSLLGLFAKAPFLYLVAKMQKKYSITEATDGQIHTPTMTIVLNFALGIIYQGLKAVHFFESDFIQLGNIFIGLGVAGLAMELWRHLTRHRSPDESRLEAALGRAADDLIRMKNSFASRRKKKYLSCQAALSEVPKTELRVFRQLPQ